MSSADDQNKKKAAPPAETRREEETGREDPTRPKEDSGSRHEPQPVRRSA